MSDDKVQDDEILYRRVPQVGVEPACFVESGAGIFTIQSSAFTDKDHHPSVDRAALCNHDPSYSQRKHVNLELPDLVIWMSASEIRGSGVLEHNDQPYQVEVSPDPLPNNPAHARIHTIPELPKNKNAFRKLKIRLAWVANEKGPEVWAIPPPRLRRSS